MQTALSASLAWYLAGALLGQDRPFVAAIAAVISVGAVAGQTLQRSAEWILGVAFGLAVADLIVFLIGSGTIQIGVVVALAMGAAMMIGGGPMLVTEAGVSAMLVATLDPSTTGLSPDRFLEALVGGAVALLVSSLLPNHPEKRVQKAARPIFDDLVAVLRATAGALQGGDLHQAEKALIEARRIDHSVSMFKETLSAGYKIARYSPPRRRTLGHLDYYATATEQLDLAVRDTRTLARAAATTLRAGNTVPRPLPEAILDLARSVEDLAAYLEKTDRPARARRYALSAAGYATAVLLERNDLETSLLVGQIRATAVDLLRASGLTFAESLTQLREETQNSSEAPPVDPVE